MAYSVPLYLTSASIDDSHLQFTWDDWRASDVFQYNPDGILAKAGGLTPRAKVVVGIGMYEWIMWRFRSVSEDPVPLQIAEAAWCASVDRTYMEYIEFGRRNWLGPVRGPLWCAMTWLIPLVFSGEHNPEECESGLTYLPRLAMHVLPRPAAFESWLQGTLDRLVQWYPAPPEDPFEDPLNEREEERRGPWVAREVLDPEFAYEPERAAELVSRYLRSVDPRSNPFLRSPDEMKRRGFNGSPYVL